MTRPRHRQGSSSGRLEGLEAEAELVRALLERVELRRGAGLSWPAVLLVAALTGVAGGIAGYGLLGATPTHERAQPETRGFAARMVTGTRKPQGIDVSRWNGDIDWTKVRDQAYAFVFIKASQGRSSTDPNFSSNWANAADAGLLRGAYHVLDPRRSGTEQARHFLATLGSDPGELSPGLGLERRATNDCVVPAGEWVETATEWISTVSSALDRPVLIYTNAYFWSTCLERSDALASSPLWVAGWSGDDPHIPAAWNDWTFWQYTNRGHVPGIDGNVDVSHFNGDPIQLRSSATPKDQSHGQQQQQLQ